MMTKDEASDLSSCLLCLLSILCLHLLFHLLLFVWYERYVVFMTLDVRYVETKQFTTEASLFGHNCLSWRVFPSRYWENCKLLGVVSDVGIPVADAAQTYLTVHRHGGLVVKASAS